MIFKFRMIRMVPNRPYDALKNCIDKKSLHLAGYSSIAIRSLSSVLLSLDTPPLTRHHHPCPCDPRRLRGLIERRRDL